MYIDIVHSFALLKRCDLAGYANLGTARLWETRNAYRLLVEILVKG